MSAARPLGVGVIGLGFMGRQHIASYRAAEAAGLANRLVAVCDPDPDRRAGRAGPRGNLESASAGERFLDPAAVRACTSADDLLADPAVELVSVCSWTETHVPLAVAALAAGKHVLVEKPVALSSAAAEALVAAARAASTAAGALCMPAMCMRFWPAWSWLREAVASRTFGAARSATFTRVGARPDPGHPFYGDDARSGGALLDVHVHDADFVRWIFGAPQAVTATGSLAHVVTSYHYARGPERVLAEGGWDLPTGSTFRMRYRVEFEGVTADFDLQRDPQLRIEESGRSAPVALPPGNGYDHEIRALVAALAAGAAARSPVPVEDAVAVLRLLEAERESLATGRRIDL